MMSPKPLRLPTDRAPALMQMLWERYGILPRNLIFVEVTHRKVPYIHDSRYRVTVFDRDRRPRQHHRRRNAASASWKSPMSSSCWRRWRATRRSTCRPTATSGSCMSRWRTCCRRARMGWLRRLRFRLFLLLRQVSQPAYYYYGLGDEVQLSAEIIPVRVH